MTHAKRIWAAPLVLGLAGLVACATSQDGLFATGDRGRPAGADGGSRSDEASPSAGTSQARATGVVLVHAAAFPAFRLCFENLPELPPQPDSKVMPEANVVGVEMGSLVRIDPLVPPGRIYVIHQKYVPAATGDTDIKCGKLVGELDGGTPGSLTKDTEYHVITERLTQPLGTGNVQILAITGCGSRAYLNALGTPSTSCGADYDTTSGNLSAKVLDVFPRESSASDTRLPVQLFPLSAAIAAFEGARGSTTVAFGALTGDAGGVDQRVPGARAFVAGEPTELSLAQKDPAIYGSFGFRMSIEGPGRSATIDQTLASVQELSAPNELPTTYYRTASNYALLLVGDPAHRPFLDGGAPNPTYNLRRAVHLLAVPVLDPTTLDAGTPDAATPGAGDGG